MISALRKPHCGREERHATWRGNLKLTAATMARAGVAMGAIMLPDVLGRTFRPENIIAEFFSLKPRTLSYSDLFGANLKT